MRAVATIAFRDPDNNDDGLAIVRAASGRVLLALSLRSNGDAEVSLPIQDGKRLIAALQEAVALAAGDDTESVSTNT
jgi:hypothetical protein